MPPPLLHLLSGLHLLWLLLLLLLCLLLGAADSARRSGGCEHAPNKNLCLPKTYSKFELPDTDGVNVVEIGIDISDVLRINDKVRKHDLIL